MFGLVARWKRNRPDQLTRLAQAIEAIGEEDRKLVDESARAEKMRLRGARDLHGVCSVFVDALNLRLSQPALRLDPPFFNAENYTDGMPCLFQINLRGRLLQIEFKATEELCSTEDFRRPYVLYGTVRSFNQAFLNHNTVDEKAIFYCPHSENGQWHYFESRTYGTGLVTQDFLVAELAHLL